MPRRRHVRADAVHGEGLEPPGEDGWVLLNGNSHQCGYMINPDKRCSNMNAIFRMNFPVYRQLNRYQQAFNVNPHITNHLNANSTLCWQHCRKVTGFIVRDGNLGFGRELIFAPNHIDHMPPITPGQVFAVFRKNIVSAAEMTRRYGEDDSAPYGNQFRPNARVRRNVHTDGIIIRDLADYTNDCRDIAGRVQHANAEGYDLREEDFWELADDERDLVNAHFIVRHQHLCLVATQQINPGTAIRINYGRFFWAGMYCDEDADGDWDPCVNVRERYRTVE